MTQKRLNKIEASFHREPSSDRFLLSLNDWYGLGVLRVLVNYQLKPPIRYYCTRAGSMEAYKMGLIHGRKLLNESTIIDCRLSGNNE